MLCNCLMSWSTADTTCTDGATPFPLGSASHGTSCTRRPSNDVFQETMGILNAPTRCENLASYHPNHVLLGLRLMPPSRIMRPRKPALPYITLHSPTLPYSIPILPILSIYYPYIIPTLFLYYPFLPYYPTNPPSGLGHFSHIAA